MQKKNTCYQQILDSLPGSELMQQKVKDALKIYLDFYGDVGFEKSKQYAMVFFKKCLDFCLDSGKYQDALFFIQMGIDISSYAKQPGYNYLDKFLDVTNQMNTLEEITSSVGVLEYLCTSGLIWVNNTEMEAREKVLEYLIFTGPGLEVMDRVKVLEIVSDAGLTMYSEELYNKIKEDEDYFNSLLFVTQRDVQDEKLEYVRSLFEFSDGTRDEQNFNAIRLINDMSEYLKEHPSMLLSDDDYMDDDQYAAYAGEDAVDEDDYGEMEDEDYDDIFGEDEDEDEDDGYRKP